MVIHLGIFLLCHRFAYTLINVLRLRHIMR